MKRSYRLLCKHKSDFQHNFDRDASTQRHHHPNVYTGSRNLKHILMNVCSKLKIHSWDYQRPIKKFHFRKGTIWAFILSANRKLLRNSQFLLPSNNLSLQYLQTLFLISLLVLWHWIYTISFPYPFRILYLKSMFKTKCCQGILNLKNASIASSRVGFNKLNVLTKGIIFTFSLTFHCMLKVICIPYICVYGEKCLFVHFLLCEMHFCHEGKT